MKKKIILILLMCIFYLSLIKADLLIPNIVEYSIVFFSRLAPATFLFFTLSTLLINYGFINVISKILRRDSSIFFVILVSLVSGFPSGAKICVELLDKGIIDKKCADYLIIFTHFPNPLFILGSLNILINDLDVCMYILLSIILSNFIIGLIIYKKREYSSYKNDCNVLDFSEELVSCSIKSIKIILNIFCISLFFFIVSFLITDIVSLPILFNTFILGLFDLVNGIFSTEVILNPFIKYLFILIFLSFGSISIHMQVYSIINKKINYTNFLLGRFISTCLSLVIFILLFSGL